MQVGRKLVEPPGECRSNHEVLQGLAQRLGAVHPGFAMTAMEMVDATLRASGYVGAADMVIGAAGWTGSQFPHVALPGRVSATRAASSASRRTGRRSGRAMPRCLACPTTWPRSTKPRATYPSAW